MNSAPGNRRPLKSRDAGWARAAAATLARWGVSPDVVSAVSVVCAVAGCGAFLVAGRTAGAERVVALLLAALAIQLRLLCNLLDGMVALEHGQGGLYGPIWNELPDRLADALFLVGAGYGAALAGVEWASAAGWLCALLALLTAYLRELGRGLGQPADFCGPGAKPHRMAALTLAAVISAVVEPRWLGSGMAMALGLLLISGLTGLTLVRRLRHLAARLAHSDRR